MMTRAFQIVAMVAAVALALPAFAALDDAGRSAVAFLGEGKRVHRDGKHDRVLNALRHLKDPALEPFFAYLAMPSNQASLQVHGLLGLAEISPQRKIDIARLAEVEQPEVQALLVSTALDADLLAPADMDRLLGWAGLDPSVKVIVAVKRFREPGFGASILHESAVADKLGRRGLAAMMLHQLGDAAGTPALTELNAATDPQRDPARRLMLQTAMKENFDRIGPWAYSVATDASADDLTQLLAIRTAIRFGERRAADLWLERFSATADAAERVRLALTVLHVATWSPPTLFESLRAADDPLLAQIGEAGRAIADAGPGGGDVAGQMVGLLLLHHPYTNAWALEYAKTWATPADAQLIALGLIKAFEQGPRETRARRVGETIGAVQLLHERYPEVAAAILKPMLADASGDTGNLTKQAILLGLLQSKGDASAIVADLPPPADAELAGVQLTLKARTGAPLTAAETADLRLLARGGAMLRDELRAQASWLYLRRSGQTGEALAALTR